MNSLFTYTSNTCINLVFLPDYTFFWQKNSGEYRDSNGQIVGYQEVYNNFILSNAEFTLAGDNAYHFLQDYSPEMNYYAVEAFGRTTIVSSFGELRDIITGDNGGISFSNPTEGAYLSESGIADGGKAGARYVKVVKGVGIAGSVFGMGVPTYNILSDIQTGNIINSWDVADLSVGAFSLGATIFLASNPVGWVIAGGAIYFGVRFVYDISTKP